LTEDGTVFIEAKGDTVLISESIDQPTTELLEQDVFATPVAAGK
jgi:hypothetical protein